MAVASLHPMAARARRPLLAAAPLAAAALALAWGGLSPVAPGFVGGSAEIAAPASHSSLVAQQAIYKARYKQYDGFVYQRKKVPHMRIRLDRRGLSHRPFYRILVSYQKQRPHRTGRYIEQVGWWDPMKEVEDPLFFHMKADRVTHWLGKGAQPTDMVASLLDRSGIIRRTGPNSKLGEWEWRIPRWSGPDPPEGWKYEGPHSVTWNNRPCWRTRYGGKRIKNRKKSNKNAPIIEKHGFVGYSKIPIDHTVITEPVDGNSILHQLENTELPIY